MQDIQNQHPQIRWNRLFTDFLKFLLTLLKEIGHQPIRSEDYVPVLLKTDPVR